MDTTALGYPFVEDADSLPDFPGTSLDLANAIGELVGVLASGTVTILPPTGGVTETVFVTFPVGRFPGAPRVVVSPSTATPQLVSISTNGAASTTGVNISVNRTTSTATVIRWIAHYSA